MESETQRKRVVTAILADLQDRRGLGQAWDSIDADIQKEIIKRWLVLVDQALKVQP